MYISHCGAKQTAACHRTRGWLYRSEGSKGEVGGFPSERLFSFRLGPSANQ